jgi:hypothetical protein
MTAFIASKRHNETAFLMGKIAYGKYTVNPFALGTIESQQWERGYLQAIDDDIEREIETGQSVFVPHDQFFNPMTIH